MIVPLLLFLATQGTAFSPSASRLSRPVSGQHLTPQLRALPYQPKLQPPMPARMVASDEAPALELGPKNVAFGATWLALVAWAFVAAPGEVGAAADTEMINTLIANPVNPPGVNEIWFAIWNLFAVAPIVIGMLVLPGARQQKIPANPFLLGSAAFGYFALGPYLTARRDRVEVTTEDLGWVTRNVWENKIVNYLVLALAVSIPFSSGVLSVPDLQSCLADYVALASGSRFVSVASVDIALLTLTSAVLMAEDMKRRGWEDKVPLAAASVLVPILGAAAYVAVRPGLPAADTE